MCVTEFIYNLICTLRKESILKSFGNRQEDFDVQVTVHRDKSL